MIYIKLDENEGATVKASGTSETELANNVDNIIVVAYRILRRANYSKKEAITIMEYVIYEIKRGDFDV